ncbi:DUF397 domain-containing protein [Streptomyces sp. NPDC001404]|uniref:DUF397 domain-containing protein n=1 Tax=Streptomyces sp. NPDC001404 TaxID=3364571 RepID=UPI003687C05F
MSITQTPSTTRWVKSSFCNGDGAGCLEWSPARIPTGTIPIRDSKTAPHGTTLLVPATAWQTFVTAISADKHFQ